MMPSTATYLRKSLALLEWIDSARPHAKVIVGSTTLGRWCDLAPRWWLSGNKIRLQFGDENRTLVYWVASMKQARWGARARIVGGRRPFEEIDLSWETHPEGQAPDSGSLLKAARAWARANLPGCRIISEHQASDRAHTLSGKYLRARLRLGDAEHLLLAGPEGCEDDVAHAILTQALLWLAYLRRERRLRRAPTIHLLVPSGQAAVVHHRSRFLNPDRVCVEVLEYVSGPSEQWATRHPDPPATPQEDYDFRWPLLGPFRWSPILARVMDLAPGAIQRYPRFRDFDSLRLWGLEFARVFGPERDRVCFGVGAGQTELNDDNFAELRALVDEISYYRRPDSPSPDHPFYRIQAERWLECLLLSNVEFLFPELAIGCVYPQIPVYLGKVQGRVDILGADRQGNLIVMELKVSDDPEMPLQSLDYYGRVIAHNLAGDFEKRGYFSGIRLSRARPKIYLVAPVFSFHDSLERVLRCLDPSLEVSKISINEDWRCGVRILRRFRRACGEFT
ncbi:MAG: hypothetical protein ABSC02_07060 [Acidobacteriota bacterium]|jgi:hypothetical protein